MTAASAQGRRDAIAEADRILRDACGDRVKRDLILAPLTTFRIGGPAALFLEPVHHGDLDAASEAVRATGIAFAVLGKGSNVLIADEGFPGLVLRLGRGFRWTGRDGVRLTAGAAMPLPALAGVALSQALGGLEFGVAIPGSVGGAVRMNAGAHGAETADVLDAVDVYRLGTGRVDRIASADLRLAYRRSELPLDGVVVAATFVLTQSDVDEIREAMASARAWRRRTQPLAEPNCGSVFTNPPGDHAARLIEQVGAKGRMVGGATISPKHANFIVTRDGARATDVLALIREVQDLVAEGTGVQLETEVRLLGGTDQDAA